MQWKDITKEHNDRKASVSAKSIPKKPLGGSGPYVGIIVCPQENSVPVLRSGDEVHSFAWYWDVEFL